MLNTTEKIFDSPLREHVLTEANLEALFNGTAASRYGLVNKALKKGELIRLRRGLYILNLKYLRRKISNYYLASRVMPHSYISLESALSYHGWIPERVYTTTSVITQGRSSTFHNELGDFSYQKIPVVDYEELTSVFRDTIDGRSFLIATPLRALADLVYVKKYSWQGVEFLTESLRIDVEKLRKLDLNEFEKMSKVYRSKRVIYFLNKLKEVLKNGQ